MGPVEPAAEGLPPPTAAADTGPPGKRAPLATLQNLVRLKCSEKYSLPASHVVAKINFLRLCSSPMPFGFIDWTLDL